MKTPRPDGWAARDEAEVESKFNLGRRPADFAATPG